MYLKEFAVDHKVGLEEDLAGQRPARRLVGIEQRLAEDAVGHEDHHQQDDVVHHLLQHFADHRHERAEELGHGQDPQDPDVPESQTFIFVFVTEFWP